jgi:DNA damage-inducible protein 1
MRDTRTLEDIQVYHCSSAPINSRLCFGLPLLQTQIPASSLVLLYKQRVLTDAQTLGSVGVQTQEMLECRSSRAVAAAQQQARPPAAAAAAAQPAPHNLGRSSNQLGIPDSIMSDPARVRDFIKAQPQLLFAIESQNPPMYRALMAADIAEFTNMWRKLAERLAAEKAANDERFRLANSDPMDAAAQARIEEEIRLKNVQENWEMAMEHNPEAFGSVVMLYVPMKVSCRLSACSSASTHSVAMR